MVEFGWIRRIGLCSLVLTLSWPVSAQEELTKHPTLVEMNRLSNEIRARAGLAPCVLDEKLCNACRSHAQYMAATGSFFHGDYTGRAAAAGFTGGVQENIAAGQGSIASVMSTWEHSGGHYAAIVGGYNKVGFGLAYRGGCPYWTATYGNDNVVVQQAVPVYNNYQPRRLFRRR